MIQSLGSDFDVGYSHGNILKKEINYLIADDYFRINKVRITPLKEDDIFAYVNECKEFINQHLPCLSEEIRGLACGAKIDLKEAYMIQMRRELSMLNERIFVQGDCTTIAARHNGKIILCQNIDLNSDISSFGIIHRIFQKKKPNIIMYNFCGSLGYMGMNSKGICVCINLVVSNSVKQGIPPYLMVREILKCSDINSCIECLKSLPSSSSRALTITDGCELITVEFTPNKISFLYPQLPFCRTNHFLHDDMKEYEQMNYLYLNSSFRRKTLVENLLTKNKNYCIENMLQILGNQDLYPIGIYAYSNGNIRNVETVATIAMDPSEYSFYVTKGNPCYNKASKYELI